MNLVWLFLVLTICGFVFAKVEPLLVVPALAPLVLFKNQKNPLMYLFGTVAWLWQAYLVLAWCVAAVVVTQLFMSRPSVEHRWMYYVLGFFGCLAPVQFMLSFDRQPFDREPDVARTIQQLITILLTAVGFIAFAIFPRLALPWFWIVRLVAR
jgi:hypothetical protein